MSLVVNIQNLATRIATEIKTVKGTIGDLTTLGTTAKGSTVAAINEVRQQAIDAAATGGAKQLNELTDVSIATRASGHILRFNGTHYASVPGSTYFDAAGAASAAYMNAVDHGNATYQAKSSNLTQYSNASTIYGRSLTELANASTLTGEILSASTSTSGKVQLATSAEATTGTVTNKAVTPAALKAVADTKANTSSLAAIALSGSAADLTGTLPSSVLPPLVVTDTFVVASQAEMLAVTAQKGDIAKRTDNSRTYILAAEPAATLANWVEIVSGGDVLSVAGKTGAVVLVKGDVGLSNVDNTSDAAKPISTATQTALNGKEGSVSSGTTAQYYRGDKTWQTLNKAAVGLSVVDNTSDAAKPISTATQTALNAKQASHANLTALSGLTLAADTLPYATGAGAMGLSTLTAFARTLLDDTTAAAARTTLDVYSKADIGDPTTNFVTTFETGLAAV